jgi:serine/threonine-protein kinase
MGTVYRAEDPAIHRAVAVKVLRTAVGLTPEQVAVARERFLREGQAAGGIDHPNIIRVFDVGDDEESGEMYIVMELVSGPSLETWLQEGTLEFQRAVTLIGQIASGLDAAHARGIIHRDIKPSNILLTHDGIAKLADFGITQVASSALTQDLSSLGTPAYMSPEQVKGKILSSRADLFSLGVLTYEMLSGRKPFEGPDIVSVTHAIAHGSFVPISVANPDLPQALDPVMEKILAKEPADRFESGQEFFEALLPCLSGESAGPSSRRVPVAGKRPHAAWALAATLLAVAVVAILLPRGPRGVTSDVAAPAASAPIAKAATPPPKAQAKVAATRTHATAPSKKAQPGPSAKKSPAMSAASSAPSVPSAPLAQSAPVARVDHKPAAVAPVASTADVTIRFAHRLRRGTLSVSLDGVTIFAEKFSRAKLVLVQTTIWDPFHAPAGGHKLSAKVTGEDGTTYVSAPYDVEFPVGQEIELRIGLKGDTLTVKPTAG